MALQKQPIAINFTKGLDTKTDPFQIPIGNFLTLQNSVFTTTGRLTKRNGFSNLTKLPNSDQTTLTTLNDNLLTTGSNILAYSADTNMWLDQGLVQPVQLNVQPLFRVCTSQTSADTAVSALGLTCLVYIDNAVAYYQISDSNTGQQIVQRTNLPATATSPRTFLLGPYFIITFIATVAGTPTLRYIAIPTATPNQPKVAATISANVSSLAAGYDGYVFDTNLYIAWAESGAAIGVAALTQSLIVSTITAIAGASSDLMSVTVDKTNGTVWVTYWDTTSQDGFTTAFNSILGALVTPTPIIVNKNISEITSVAQNNVLSVFYETINNYTYLDSTGFQIRTDFVSALTVTPPVGVGVGIVSATTIILRSVGLASKAFIGVDGTIYMMVAYGDTNQPNPEDDSNQPTYFLIDSLGNIYMRLAYSNGGGYIVGQVLPSVSFINSTFFTPYLITDFLTTVNKGTNLPDGTPTNAIYTQTGINLAKFTINDTNQHSSEIAGALHLTGGQLWGYDGVRPVEHSFHVWPENIVIGGSATAGSLIAQTYYYVFTYEWTDNQGNLHRSAPSIPVVLDVLTPSGTFTGHIITGSNIVTAISSFAGLQVGQHISAVGISPGTTITSLNVGTATMTMSTNATSTFTTTFTATQISAVSIHVPTLRLTYKRPPNPVRIVGYRWSQAQQTYYQFTSVIAPVINDTTIDSVNIPDGNSDANILGQTLLYTTGGVIENIAAPASIASALFSNRLFLIDAEDQNLLWFSKQVIQSVPVEMSDLLTLYVAPTTGAQGSTGPMRCLSAMDDKLIIFKQDAIYYINGAGPDNTGANSTFSEPTFITSTIGCANQNSITLIPMGLVFQSDKGIWLLGRDLSTAYIGAPVEQYNANTVMSATAIPGTNQVRFILDNNVTLMYDYFFNQWGTHNNISAISATLYQGKHTYLNSNGQIFQETPGMYLDGTRPVLMSFTTSWINVAGLQGFERFYFANLLGTYFTPFKLNVTLAYDYNSSATQAISVTPDNYSKNWGDEALWGSGPPWGGGPGNVFSARLFPEKQKCQAFQLSIQENYDPSLGASMGQGLSLSGLALIIGIKRGYRTQKASRSFG